jgi:hypothetical protein
MTLDEIMEKADRCFALAKRNRDVAADLETLGHELMAKAVELDTRRQRDEGGRSSDQTD